MNGLIRTLVLCVSVSGIAALAQDAAPARTETAKQPAATAAQSQNQGVIVAIDPVTKQIRQPEAAEVQALTGGKKTAAAVATTTLKKIQGPGQYGVGIVLDNTTMVYMVATKAADGTIANDCVTGEKAAVAKVSGAQPATAKQVPDVQ
jgi:hypothetical protein